MQITESSQVVAVPDQLSCEIADEVAILSLRNGCYYCLNPVGARVWGMLTQPIAVADIVSAIVAEYDVDPAVCQADVLRILNDLVGHGLLETA